MSEHELPNTALPTSYEEAQLGLAADAAATGRSEEAVLRARAEALGGRVGGGFRGNELTPFDRLKKIYAVAYLVVERFKFLYD